jgi:hypothetical protein
VVRVGASCGAQPSSFFSFRYVCFALFCFQEAEEKHNNGFKCDEGPILTVHSVWGAHQAAGEYQPRVRYV